MDITKIIQALSEALDDKNWDVVKELLEELIYLDDNPIQGYEKDSDVDNENLWGWNGIDWCYLILECSRDWVCLATKDSPNLNGDNSLQGLDIDWHLANAEMGFDNFVAPVQDVQSTYAYA